MVIDYSQTINRFTQLDAYPLPNINDMVQKIAQYSVFSTIDLRSAYHQIPLKRKISLIQLLKHQAGCTSSTVCHLELQMV